MNKINDFLNSGDISHLQVYEQYLQQFNPQELQNIFINIVNHLIKNKISLNQFTEILKPFIARIPEQSHNYLADLSSLLTNKEERYVAFSVYTSFFQSRDVIKERLFDKVILIRKLACEMMVQYNLLDDQVVNQFVASIQTLNPSDQMPLLCAQAVTNNAMVQQYKQQLLFNKLSLQQIKQLLDECLDDIKLFDVYQLCGKYRLNFTDYFTKYKQSSVFLYEEFIYQLLEFHNMYDNFIGVQESINFLQINQHVLELQNLLKIAQTKVQITTQPENIIQCLLIASADEIPVNIVVNGYKEAYKAQKYFLIVVLLSIFSQFHDQFVAFYYNNYQGIKDLAINCIFMCYLTEQEAFKIKDELVGQLDAFIQNDIQNQISIDNIQQVIAFLQILTLIQQKYNDLDIRQKLAGVFAGLFQHFYNEQFEIQQNVRKNRRSKQTNVNELDLYGELLLTTLFGVCVVLTNPGTKDYNLQNIGQWVNQLIEQSDWRSGSSFLGNFSKNNETLLVVYHQVIVDLLHLLQSFRYETEALAAGYLRGLQCIFAAFGEGEGRKFRNSVLVLLQKLLNVENSKKLFNTHGLNLGLLLAEFINADQSMLFQIVAGILLPAYSQNNSLIQQILIGIAAGCQLFKFKAEKNHVADKIEELLIQCICDIFKAETALVPAFTEFLAFFAVNGEKCKTKKLQEIVDKYCQNTVNSLNLETLGAYLVQKCNFNPDQIKHSELDKQRISFYNGLVKQVVSEIEGL